MQSVLEKLIKENHKWTQHGKVADYIPELSKTDPSLIGISIFDMEGRLYQAGDANHKFTMQSISKPIVLLLALLDNGEAEIGRAHV